MKTIKIGDLDYKATIEQDDCSEAPWEREDGHGPVTEWTRAAKSPGQMVLCEDRGSRRYYGFAEAVRVARRDCWDTEPYGQGSKGVRAHRAALADFHRLRAWCNDNWYYICVIVTAPDGRRESVGGIESDAGEYLDEVARELAEQLHNEEN